MGSRYRADYEDYKSGGGGDSVIMDTDNSNLGRIIGRGGTKIRELQDTYRVRIDIKKDQDDGTRTPVEISGDRNDCLECEEGIKHLLSSRGGRGGGRGGRGGGRGGGDRGPLICYNCQQEGHTARNCYN